MSNPDTTLPHLYGDGEHDDIVAIQAGESTPVQNATTREPVAKTVGISLNFWYFPELDQWKLSLTRNIYGEPILAVGPLRLRWKPIRIWR